MPEQNILSSWAQTLRQWAGSLSDGERVDIAAGHLRDLANDLEAASSAAVPQPQERTAASIIADVQLGVLDEYARFIPAPADHSVSTDREGT